MYLLDTNIISELRKSSANVKVVDFIAQARAKGHQTFISSVTLGEITQGIEKLKRNNDFEQASRIQHWVDNVLALFTKNAIVFDNACAKRWGELMAVNPHNPVDKQLVATALVHGLILVTRNVKDVKQTGVNFINPFV